MKNVADLSFMLKKLFCLQGMIVDVFPLHSSVSKMMQWADKGLISNDAITKLPPSMSKRELLAGNTSVVDKVEEVFSPHLRVPGLNKGNHKVNLNDFFDPPHAIRLL